jgi:uncharacterized protein YqjF (DUF2071 family)
MRPGRLPPIPGRQSGAESHLRTYVVDVGRRGIWMLSVDIDPLLAAVGGRIPFFLPYWWASIRIDRARVRHDTRPPDGSSGEPASTSRWRSVERQPRRELSELDDF